MAAAVQSNYHPQFRARLPVCKYFLSGTCKFGNRCRYLHPKSSRVVTPKPTAHGDPKQKRPLEMKSEDLPSSSRSNASAPSSKKRVSASRTSGVPPEADWSNSGVGFQLLAKLEGQGKGITGITIPMSSDKLYTADRDGSVRVWDCNSGVCVRVRHLGQEIGCLMSQGTWVFAGMKDMIYAWNVADKTIDDEPLCLKEPVGQVSALDSDGQELVFAAAENGAVLAYRGCSDAKHPFKLAALLEGHTKAVLCLVYGAQRLYSGSADTTVRVWDPFNFRCLCVLQGHSENVTSLVCWESFLLTSSLDRKINVWAVIDEELQVVHTQEEEHGVLSLSGMNDPEKSSVLFSSLGDGSVRMYQLPDFALRGKVLSGRKLGAVEPGPQGLFFTGDGIGTVAVWKWKQASNS